MRKRDEVHPRIADRRNDRIGPIGRPIIDDEDLAVGERLGEDGVNGLGEEGRAIVGRDEGGDEGCANAQRLPRALLA